MPVLAKFGTTVFFDGCTLFCGDKLMGCCSGSVECGGNVRCVFSNAELRLVEDGFVDSDAGVVGILRDVGGWVEKMEFEDGVVYVYKTNVDGNGVFAPMYIYGENKAHIPVLLVSVLSEMGAYGNG